MANFKGLTYGSDDMNRFILNNDDSIFVSGMMEKRFELFDRIWKHDNGRYCWYYHVRWNWRFLNLDYRVKHRILWKIMWEKKDWWLLEVLPMNWMLQKNSSSWIVISIFLKRYSEWTRIEWGDFYFILSVCGNFDTFSRYWEVNRSFFHFSCFEFTLNWM